MRKIRDMVGTERHEHKKHHSSHGKLAERIYKVIMVFGLGVTYKGFKGWLKSKKQRIGY